MNRRSRTNRLEYASLSARQGRYPARQTGSVLLTIMLLILVGSGYMLVTKMNLRAGTSVYSRSTTETLALAREALIAYAVTYIDSNPGEFGFLPCPDANENINPEGTQDPQCGSIHANSIGRLPWKTLGLPPLRDGAGECLWYAVSGAYKEGGTKAEMLNEDSYGTFEIYSKDAAVRIAGDSPASRAVAVIFAPGRSTGAQNRAHTAASAELCKGNYTPDNYLEGTVGIDNYTVSGLADTIDTFIQGGNDIDAVVNDVLVYITADDIFDRIRKRSDYTTMLYEGADSLTLRITECLAYYSYLNQVNSTHPSQDNQSLPWPAPLDLDDYRDNQDYDDLYYDGPDIVLSGRLPVIVDNSNATIGNSALTQNNLIEFCKDSFWPSDEKDKLERLWVNWKDHLYYAVSQQFQPRDISSFTPQCNNGNFCITLDDPAGSDWAAVVFFSGSGLPGDGRTAPPIDADARSDLNNYLEGANTGTYVDGDNNYEYSNMTVSATFNDILYCINDHDSSNGFNAFEAGKCP